MKTFSRRTSIALSVALLVTTAGIAPPTQATGVPVVDGAHISTSLSSQFSAVAQYGKQVAGMAKDAQHYMATYQHYQQELIKLQRMVSKLSFGTGRPLQKVDETYMVDETCGGGASGFSLTSVFKSLLPNPKGNILEQQRTICGMIQINRNMKFNETVDFLTKTRKSTTQELSDLASRLDTSKNKGNVDQNTNDQLAAANRLQAIYDNYQSQMQYYETQISSLEEFQRTLALGALKGSDKGPLGTLVKTATLQAALNVGK